MADFSTEAFDKQEIYRQIKTSLLTFNHLKASALVDSLGDDAAPGIRDATEAVAFNRSNDIGDYATSYAGRIETKVIGNWMLRRSDTQLAIEGVIFANVERAHILVNGRLLKVTNCAPSIFGGCSISSFSLTFRESVIKRLPKRAAFSVACKEGILVANTNGKIAVELVEHFPESKGGIFKLLSTTSFVTKHGGLRKKLTADTAWQERVFQTHGELKELFKAKFNKDIFLIYGTLLGFVREGNFIASDDDFDVGYLSNYEAPEDVRAEMVEIIHALKDIGKRCFVPDIGGFFKYLDNSCHLDVFPGWIEDGRFYMNNTTSIEAAPEMFLPLRQTEMLGHSVLIPNSSEQFLLKKYGPGWTRPDPGFQRAPLVPGAGAKLSRSRLTLKEISLLNATEAANDDGDQADAN